MRTLPLCELCVIFLSPSLDNGKRRSSQAQEARLALGCRSIGHSTGSLGPERDAFDTRKRVADDRSM